MGSAEKDPHDDIAPQQLVQTGLESIAKHYVQPIHCVEETPPYFDRILGRPLVVASFVNFWIQRLKVRLEASETLHERIASWIVQGYASDVRPALMTKPSILGVPVLQQFEILLAEWLHVTQGDGSSPSPSSTSIVADEQKSSVKMVCAVIELIASDITLLTASKKEQYSDYIRANIVLPTLLRIAGHCIIILSMSRCQDKLIFQDEEVKRILVRLVLSLLHFQNFRLDPSLIAESLIFNNSDITSNIYPFLESVCSYCPLPAEVMDNVDTKHFKQHLSAASYNWETVELKVSASWNDPITGVAKRAARYVWYNLGNLVERFYNLEAQEELDRMSDIVVGGICSGDVCLFARAIRAHFFGRDMHDIDNKESRKLSTQIVLGRTVVVEKPLYEKEKPYEEIDSRVHSVLNSLSLLRDLRCGTGDSQLTRQVLEDLLPVCYALIDSPNKVHTALGCASLIHLMDITAGNVCLTHDYVWSEFADGTLSVLNLAFKTCRDGPLILLIGQAQARLFQFAKHCSRERRQASRQWLSSLYDNVHRPSTESLCWELLVGGIIPLLWQHAKVENADAMEFGRLGLSAFLPLIARDRDLIDSKTKIAALVALINLMMGAYPILKFHGGKIMVSLLVAACEYASETEAERTNNEIVVLLAKHAAAVALVLCESNGHASQSLENLLLGEKSYEDRLIMTVHDIQARSIILKERETTETLGRSAALVCDT